MARAPKIPGLRSWTKVDGRKGYRTVWQYSSDELQGLGPVQIFPVPSKSADGPIRAYYALISGKEVTPKLPTKTAVIESFRQWLRDNTHVAQGGLRANPVVEAPRSVNPLTRAETREALETARSVSLEARGHQERGEDVRASTDFGYSLGMQHAVKSWGAHPHGKWRKDLKGGRKHLRPNPGVPFDAIGPGDRVTILVPAGRGRGGQEYKEATGRAVMRGPHGWALNMGGPHGTPGVATPENFVRATRGTGAGKRAPYWMRRGNPGSRHVHTITAGDVGKPSHRIAGRSWLASEWIGRVMPQDVGKRVYLVDGILQVENDAQRDARLRRSNPQHRYPKASPRTRACVAKKVPRYMHEGMPQQQAIAAAFGKCKTKRRNPTGAICRHTLPLQKGGHGKVEVCYPQGVFASLKAAVVNIQRELRAKYGRLKSAPALRRADWAFTDAGRTRGRWTFQG